MTALQSEVYHEIQDIYKEIDSIKGTGNIYYLVELKNKIRQLQVILDDLTLINV